MQQQLLGRPQVFLDQQKKLAQLVEYLHRQATTTDLPTTEEATTEMQVYCRKILQRH